jgi:predicted component of type VI protein secretion system
MGVRLKFVLGPMSGQTVPLEEGELVIGRDKDCGLGPMSDFISRHHCVLTLTDDTLTIRDLGSKNGTFVNGSRVGTVATILTHGAIVWVGDFAFQIDFATIVDPIPEPIAGAQAMAGTSVFDGETLDSANPNRNLPPTANSAPAPQGENNPPIEADAPRPSA